MKYKLSFSIAVMFFSIASFCQDSNTDTANNLTSVDGIINRLYNVISGPVGQERDWNSFKDLFVDDARLYIAIPDEDSGTVLKSITPDEYVNRNQSRLADEGFSEEELYRVTNSYGAGTQVFSTYESHYKDRNGSEEITKGINNIQLFYDGQRYYIVNIFWDANAKNIEVPERYLPKDKHTDYQINL